MFARHFTIAAVCALSATAVTAQTHGQLLERAIFAETSVGDLDRAIRLYSQLVSAPGVPPDVVARAQSRLPQVRRQRDETLRATALAAQQTGAPRGLPGRIDPQASAGRAPAPPAARQASDGCCGAFSDNYNPGAAVTVSGKIAQIEFLYPQTVIYMAGDDGNKWGFTVASANDMIRSGWTKNNPKLGELVVVSGYAARGDGECPAPLPNACATFADPPGARTPTFKDGAFHASASMITRGDMTIFDRVALEEQLRLWREEAERRRAAELGR